MNQNVLLLQGQIGPFFGRFARDLQAGGYTVYKLNFNGGDEFCYRGPNPIAYTGRPEAFGDYLRDLLRRLDIGRIYLFGDLRTHHETALHLARQMGLRAFVFEEGYLRPDYLTLEENGVNAHSSLPRDPGFYRSRSPLPALKPVRVPHGFLYMAAWAMTYYIASALKRRRYPHYRHHRPLNVWGEGGKWLLGYLLKAVHLLRGRALMSRLLARHANRYFVVPLQVHCDGQILRHSRFGAVSLFIEEVIASFAGHAPPDAVLVIKHHPMDRAYSDYDRQIRALAATHGLHNRVCYAHDLHLPTLLDHARGTVVINSTVGLSSLQHGTPVIALSQAVYNFPGMTHQGPLDDFWRHPGRVDTDLLHDFTAHLLRHNQVNGSFFRRLPGAQTHCGAHFPAEMREHLLASGPQSAAAAASLPDALSARVGWAASD